MEKLKTQLAKRHALPLTIAGLIVVALIIVPEPVFASAADAIAGVLAQLILWIASLVGSIALYLLEIFFTKVISYNDFIHHGVVVKGWQMVRNVVNVGFVGALLVIGFGTMFGISRINWRQQVPSLLIGAVVVNFSRLICGLLIDVGQVFMMAFANAIQQAGAGNFVALFSIDKLQSLSSANISGATLLFAAIFALVLSVIILIVIFVFMAILTYRIVVLWVLIILSPIAFFIGSIKGVFNAVGGEYQQWWQKFTASITIGPILLFFLWLALTAVAGEDLTIPGGSVDTVPDSSGLAATGFNVEVLTSFIIAIALLLAGLEVAQQTAGQIGGFAGKAAAMGKGYATKVASAPVAYGAVAAGWALRKTGAKAKGAAKAVGGGVRDYYRGRTATKRQDKMAAERRRAERLATDTGPLGAIRRAQGRSRLGKIGAREELEKKRQTELINKHKGDFDTFSPDEKKAFIERVKGKKHASETEKAKVAAIEQSTVLDSKKFEEMMGSDPETAKKWYKSVKDRAKDSGDEDTTKRLATMAESRPSLAAEGRDGLAAAYSNMDKNQIKRINVDEFKDPDALAAALDAGVFKQVLDSPKDFSKSMQDMAARFAGPAGTMNAARVQATQSRFEGERERITRDTSLTDEQRETANRRNESTRAVVVGSMTDGLQKVMDRGVKLQDVDATRLNPDDIAKVLKTSAPDAFGELRGLLIANASAGRPDASLAAWERDITRLAGSARPTLVSGASTRQLAALKQNEAALAGSARPYGYNGATPPATTGGPHGGGWSPDQRREFKASVTNSPNIVNHFSAELDANGGNNDLSRAAAETITKDGLKGLLEDLDKSRGSADEAQKQEMLERLGQIAQQWEGKLTGDMAKAVDEAAQFYRKRVASQLERRPYS